MVSLKFVALWGTQLLAVNAVPATAPKPTAGPNIQSLIKSNRMVQVAAGNIPAGPIALSIGLAKYHQPVPSDVQIAAASAASETAQVQATDLPYDMAYLVEVNVGKKTLLMDFDTGSSDLWVFSTALPSSMRSNHTLYGLGGKLVPKERWSISYGDGSSASGKVYADSVEIGGVSVSGQAVEAATSVSSEFIRDEMDGLVGLGFEEGNTCYPRQCLTFMQNAASLMPLPLFTATLRHGKPGEYDFGFIDKTKYTGSLTNVSLNDASRIGYWEFTAGGYSINRGPKVTHSMDAIADTGTSLVIVDPSVASAYYSPVTGAHYNSTLAGYIFPCANRKQLPTLGFYMSGVAHTMPSAYGLYGALNKPAGYCYGGVQSNGGAGLNVFGDVWLKSQFVVFNYNNGGSSANIAFAQQAGVST